MAAEVLKHPNFEEFETDDFFEVALEEGYTKQGKELISSIRAHFLLNVSYLTITWPSILSDHLVQG